MPDYDNKLFDPSAPVAKVTLRNPETGVTISEVPLLIDSGADATVIPQASVTLIGRNILNHMSILHDGPNLAWDEQNPSSL